MFLGMRFFLTFAYQMQAVIIGIYIYHLTHDTLALGLVGLAEAIPAIGVSLYGGYIADKSEKRRLLLMIIGVMALSSSVLLWVTHPTTTHTVTPALVVPVLYTVVFITGLARGFMGPAVFSLMAQIVPKEIYPNSSTWNSSSWQTASIIGPAVGGLLYGYYGVTSSFIAIVLFMIISFGFAFTFKTHEARYVPKENIFASLREGIRFVFSNRMVISAISLDLFSVFFGGAVALMPVLANDILKVGPQGLGIMRAAPALGSVLTMMIMTRYSPMGKPWRNLLIAVTGFGLSIIGYGLSRHFYLTLVFLFFEGAFDSVSVVIRSTIMQLLTPDAMRGRVSAVNSMFIGSSNEIGAFESGLTAKLMGTIPAIVFGGSMTLVVMSATWLKTKKLINLSLDEIHTPVVADTAAP
ncbi:MAG: MFS transporter [Mucilaginibacter polytrichastri]|nr:MFS transporter [Mucilaginibacter polytrichastri]